MSKRIPCYQTIKVPILLFLLIYTGIIYRLYTQISLSNTSPIITSPFPRTDGVLLNYFRCHGNQANKLEKRGSHISKYEGCANFPIMGTKLSSHKIFLNQRAEPSHLRELGITLRQSTQEVTRDSIRKFDVMYLSVLPYFRQAHSANCYNALTMALRC